MELVVEGNGISGGTIGAPPSKSMSHRAIINAALSNDRSIIKSPLFSKDIYSTIEGIEAFGAEVEERKEDLVIRGFGKKPSTPNNVVDLGNSGTSLRFLCSIASLLNKGFAVFTGDKSLRDRPNDELIKALNELGANVFSTQNDGSAPLVVSGKLRGGKVEISGEVSSQFVSSLLTSLTLCESDSNIYVRGELKSKPYVNMTISLLKKSGVEVCERDFGYFIEGSQCFSPITYQVEGDYSSAANVLVLGALSNGVEIRNLEKKTSQGDFEVINLLKDIGADIEELNDGFFVSPSDLSKFSIDLGDNPDLFPILAVLGSFIEETVILENIEHIRYKECDRVSAMQQELGKMGIETRISENNFYVIGFSPSGARLDGHNDHRIVMALTVASLLTKEKSFISDSEAINVSYPSFYEDIKKLGGEIKFQENK